MRKLIVALCIGVAGCSSSSPSAPGPVNVQLTLAPGQSSRIDSGTSVRFVGVTSDSRCPAAAICVWSGDAAARFEVVNTPNTAPVDLHTTLDPKQAEAGGLKVELQLLAPYPVTSNDIPPSDYRATIRVTR